MKLNLQHLFVPHEKNNHRAHLLKPLSLSLIIGIYLLNQFFIKALAVVKPGVLGYSSEITVQKVYDQTNQERTQDNLPYLHFNPTLAKSAEAKARDMFAHNYWSHNSPQGKTPWDFFKAQDYNYSVAGENLAKDFYDTNTLLAAWMNSPTHRANITSDKYQEIGIAVVNGTLNGVSTTLVVQHFGTPLDPSLINTTSTIEADYLKSVAENSSVSTSLSSGSFVLGQTRISPLEISRMVGLIFFVIIIIALFIDGYVTLKHQTHRISGSAASHIGFLMIIFMMLFITRSGNIF